MFKGQLYSDHVADKWLIPITPRLRLFHYSTAFIPSGSVLFRLKSPLGRLRFDWYWQHIDPGFHVNSGVGKASSGTGDLSAHQWLSYFWVRELVTEEQPTVWWNLSRESGNLALVPVLPIKPWDLGWSFSPAWESIPHLLAEMISVTLIPVIPTWPLDNLRKHTSPIFMEVSKKMHSSRLPFSTKASLH